MRLRQPSGAVLLIPRNERNHLSTEPLVHQRSEDTSSYEDRDLKTLRAISPTHYSLYLNLIST